MGSNRWIITRREFLKASAKTALGLWLAPASGLGSRQDGTLKRCRFGVVTDSHYADLTPRGNRYYPQSLDKMRECVDLMNDKEVDFLVELGDFTNGTHDGTTEHLAKIESVLRNFDGPRYHVLGNHDLDSLSKAQCKDVLENSGIPGDATYYSFDRNGIHFVVLDANYSADGTPYDSGNFVWTDTNLPQDQLNWLRSDLSETDLPTVVFGHQLLDWKEGESRDYYVNNAPDAREILEKSDRVLTVFQGHRHSGQYRLINGIHYYTLKAMVEGSGEENSSYAIVDIYDDNTVTVTGYRRAVSSELKPAVR